MALSAEVINRAKELYAKLSAAKYIGLSPSQKRRVLLETYDEITASLDMLPPDIQGLYYEILPEHIAKLQAGDDIYADYVREKLVDMLTVVSDSEPAPPIPPAPAPPKGGKSTSKIGKKFDKCVKSVRRTVKARRGSTKESAAIAICTTSILYPKKRTIKKYRKGRLVTQRRKAF